MLVRVALRLVVLALIIGLVASLVNGIKVDGGFWTWLWLAVLFSLINMIVGPILRLLSLPFIVLTLGLFLLVDQRRAARVSQPCSRARSRSTASARRSPAAS